MMPSAVCANSSPLRLMPSASHFSSRAMQPALTKIYKNSSSRWLAAGLAVSLGGFALGAGILAALFPTGLTKDLSDPSALIHGIASALGFFALLFLPLWRALLALETDSPVMAWACFAALGLALVFFTLFVLSDKDRFQGTAVAREGLWEQLCLAAMYVPLLLDAIVHLISAP